jgi:hypothetical protein
MSAPAAALPFLAQDLGIVPGDWFRIVHKGHFAYGRIHCCTGLPNIKVKGEPVLDLGSLVQFTIADYYGRPAHHVLPLEWCQPAERPSLARRVK